jgi:hypothetical protein
MQQHEFGRTGGTSLPVKYFKSTNFRGLVKDHAIGLGAGKHAAYLSLTVSFLAQRHQLLRS